MTAAIFACGTDNHHFRLEGRFLKMNQGEFYVYSPDGSMSGFDTIKVNGGRFAYEMPCEREGIVIIVLPNFSEIPIFVKPGKSVDMKADASHIKDIEITGTDDNETMTKWRKNTDGLSPADMRKQAEDFIRKHPASNISLWMLRKYFIQRQDADQKKSQSLAAVMEKGRGETGIISLLNAGLQISSQARKGDKLPSFTATDTKGNKVSSTDLMKGKAVIVVWASWNYDGVNLQHMLRYSCEKMEKEGKSAPKVLSISMDPDKKITEERLRNDITPWPIICDGKMWDSPLVSKLGITTIPDNIVIVDGKIVERHIKPDEVIKIIENP